MTHQYTWHSDPGHGWLAVPLADVVTLGVRVQPEGERDYDAAAISRFSYVAADGLTVYLEEDCNAGAFLTAARAAGWTVETFETAETRGNSPIRRMRSAAVLGSAMQAATR